MKQLTINVVIIEDNQDHAVLLKKRLEVMHYKFESIAFEKGEEAAAYLETVLPESEKKPNLIFLDLGLPDEDGLSILSRIRDVPALRKTPIIVITASDDRDDIQQTYKRGGTLYMKKPWTEEALQDVMTQLQATNRLD